MQKKNFHEHSRFGNIWIKKSGMGKGKEKYIKNATGTKIYHKQQ